MTPSPYQSKLLRLAIAQYRNGLDRHRKAFRYARSTTVVTVKIGTALTMVPVLAIVQVSQMAGRRLRQSIKKSKVFGVGGGSTKLLNFSGFAEAALSVSESTSFAETPTAERSMVQALRVVGDCLSVRQLGLLLKMEKKIRPLKVGVLEKLSGESKLAASGQITGIASDLETRSLILVINYLRVWNGLSADQQRQLQRQIGLFSSSVGTIRVADSGELTLSEKATAISRRRNVLSHPFRSFWVEVLRTVAWMEQRYRERMIAHKPSDRSQVKGADLGLRSLPEACMPDRDEGAIARLSASKTVLQEAVSSAADRGQDRTKPLITQGVGEAVERGDQLFCLDADVITVGYIEHPFERFLKWVDRILLWIEGQWQLLKRRLGL